MLILKYKQIAKTEKRILLARTKADMDKLDPFFSVNNNYLHYMKKEEVNLPPSITYKVLFVLFINKKLK